MTQNETKNFIGLSVEGLNIAYAIQQNLSHDADITIWDPGLFELCKTIVETLKEKLSDPDFGIFVYSEDDITILREESIKPVRDKVVKNLPTFYMNDLNSTACQ